MLGVDPYWERIHLAYHYEVEKRTGVRGPETVTSNTVFEPGEIAHINDDGTLIEGFYDFMEWQGMTLSREERLMKEKVKRDSHGRDCLVVQRLDNGRYIICYLASFRQAHYGKKIQNSVGKLFAIAIDDTPEYPPGPPSIKMVPKWRGCGFLYAIPVPRQNLVRHKAANSRFILRMGELERVKRLIVQRVKIFKAQHIQLRRKHLRGNGFFLESDPPTKDAEKQRMANEVAVGEPTALAASAGDVKAAGKSATPPPKSFQTVGSSTIRPTIRPQNWDRSPYKLPRIHYLETNEYWLNLRWLLQTMQFDIMNSSYYLNDIDIGRRVYKGAASLMKRLPIH